MGYIYLGIKSFSYMEDMKGIEEIEAIQNRAARFI